MVVSTESKAYRNWRAKRNAKIRAKLFGDDNRTATVTPETSTVSGSNLVQ